MYNNYEEYMQSVLGMNIPNNTYMQNNNYYEPRAQDINMQEINKLYPEIYGIVYPMVQKACTRARTGMISKAQIDEIVNEIYDWVEPRDNNQVGNETNVQLRNGDVKNPRIKETRRPESTNHLLRDLIRILVIRELLQNGWRQQIPGPGPGFGMQIGRPPMYM